jgi:hypothetical protein
MQVLSAVKHAALQGALQNVVRHALLSHVLHYGTAQIACEL